MILQHDNAWPYVAKPIKTYPDIASSDYYLFRSMAHGLADQQFRSYEDIKKRQATYTIAG